MPLYALAIFTGAFLLFLVQPLIGKYILPWFGGGPGVWSTCMLFFQVLLLGGYAYAHLVSRWLTPRRQALAHLCLLAGAVALLPIIPADSWKPQGQEAPVWRILMLLTVALGLPYFVLSTTGPLLQHWFSRTHPGRSPYRLYALSNLGSLLALISFPFLLEPNFTRLGMARSWGAGLVLYALLCGACAIQLWKKANAPAGDDPGAGDCAAPGPASTGSPATLSPAQAANPWLLWLCLPFCASVLLLAVTNKLCQDVAVIPFLWVAPLALYLLSFIICFDSPRWYVRGPYGVALAAALGGICWALFDGPNWPVWKQVAVYCAGLFVCCMVCHGELYRLRPPPERLTSFYLVVALGGALGGFFVAVLAPLVFVDYYELHWGLFLCGALFAVVCGQKSPADAHLAGWSGWRWVTRAALAVGLVALGTTLWRHGRNPGPDTVYRSRNFYGVLTVYEHQREEPADHHFLLQHGRITHGLQFVDPEQAQWHTTYYSEQSGVGMAVRALPAGPRRIGVVGLGTGSLATYAQRGDTMRIYEINPQVERLATSYFSYLSNSPARIEVVLGDARLSLEREPAQEFDLLALDAFSSDAIPVHLLTREAFEIYQRHMKPDGVILVHISNHFLNLEPVVMTLARQFQYKTALVDYDETQEEWWLYSSTWVLLCRNPAVLDRPEIVEAAKAPGTNTVRMPLWTDDFASVARILK